jgi:hypothetical membrane protein
MSTKSITRSRANQGSKSRGRSKFKAAPAWAGVLGPLLFTGAFLAQEALRRDEYSPIAEPVSALEAGPNGWVLQANFLVFGVLTMVYAIGFHRTVGPARLGRVGPLLLTLSGLGLILAAVFPLREDAAGATYDSGGHVIAGVMFFTTSAIGLIALSLRLSRDPGWQHLARYTAAAGIVAMASFFLMGALVMPDDAPLHEWAGLAQRAVILVVVFPCRIVLATRMLRVVRGA